VPSGIMLPARAGRSVSSVSTVAFLHLIFFILNRQVYLRLYC